MVRLRLRECAPWASWGAEEKERHVRVLLAPLRAEPVLVAELVAFADEAFGALSRS